MKKTNPPFTNRIYRAELSRTPAGSPIVTIVPINAKGPSSHHRQVAAFIYDLASEMEKRSEALGARWAVTHEPGKPGKGLHQQTTYLTSQRWPGPLISFSTRLG